MAYESPRGIISFDDAKIIIRNFAGKKSQYNAEGDRNFGLVIQDPMLAQQLIDDGWNVKVRQPRTENEDVFYWTPIKVKYGQSGPYACIVSGDNRRELGEDEIACLDSVAIERVDLDIRAYEWHVNGKTGISGYLQGIKVTQKYNRFAQDS